MGSFRGPRRFGSRAVRGGGSTGSTTILVSKVYRDGFVGLDLGLSSAKSVTMMIIVTGLTVLQFRFVERRVHYGSRPGRMRTDP